VGDIDEEQIVMINHCLTELIFVSMILKVSLAVGAYH